MASTALPGGAPDLSGFQQRQNAARQDFAAKSTANTFSRTLSQQRGSRNLSDMARSFRRALPGQVAQQARRGMAGPGVRSGVYQRAMQNYLGDYQRSYGRMQEDNFNDLRQFDFNQSGYQAELDNILANLEAEKAAMIANTAQNIQALRPFMGS